MFAAAYDNPELMVCQKVPPGVQSGNATFIPEEYAATRRLNLDVRRHCTRHVKATNRILKTLLALCLSFTACRQAPTRGAGYEPQQGDIAFQSLPHNPLIDAIEGATASTFSHCGILHRAGTQWLVIEAIGPVRETPFAAWIAQARDQRYTVFRLKTPYRAKIPSFIQAAQSYEGLPYDIHYDLDDSAMYCSELIYKAFHRATGEDLGRLQTLGELQWQPHAEVIKQIEGGKLPLDRKMITPRSLSEAKQLEKIYTK